MPIVPRLRSAAYRLATFGRLMAFGGDSRSYTDGGDGRETIDGKGKVANR